MSGDEVISDSFPAEDLLDKNGDKVPGLMSVDSRNVAKGGEDIDVGGGNAFGGAGEDEAVDDSIETVNNLIDAFHYTESGYGSKKELMGFFKAYLKGLKKKFEEEGKDADYVKQFMSEAQVAVKYLAGRFKDLEFYMTESLDPEAGMVFAHYKENAACPSFIYFLWGLKEVKC